mmetsp:Transcript_54799/g.163975  ORF Transcript_54799/g.163975 Transcript_54799/m.163975 type:complete len:206 (-) Transcript_54799:2351-2968(-)
MDLGIVEYDGHADRVSLDAPVHPRAAQSVLTRIPAFLAAAVYVVAGDDQRNVHPQHVIRQIGPAGVRTQIGTGRQSTEQRRPDQLSQFSRPQQRRRAGRVTTRPANELSSGGIGRRKSVTQRKDRPADDAPVVRRRGVVSGLGPRGPLRYGSSFFDDGGQVGGIEEGGEGIGVQMGVGVVRRRHEAVQQRRIRGGFSGLGLRGGP